MFTPKATGSVLFSIRNILHYFLFVAHWKCNNRTCFSNLNLCSLFGLYIIEGIPTLRREMYSERERERERERKKERKKML
jgi:hypothetical protein